LYLDYRISHLLIDEFQDTSRSQLELFQLVIRAWQDDGNTTFFCVGDPMQSIYKFRDADVAVFTECREHGIGDVSLVANYLSANFRSDPKLVDWCNETFAHLFEPSASMQLGGVSYNPSQAVNKTVSSAAVSLTSFEDERIETNETVARIQHLLKQDDCSTIAILCRARTHVAALIKLLDAKNIDWQATDMDSLATKPIILDLLSLHSTLLDRGARLAWFSILRSPMFGFTLTQLSEYAEDQNLLQVITQHQVEDPRLSRLCQAHTWATQHLHELTLREVLEGYWFRCGGIAAYPGQAQQHAQSFMDLLDDMGDAAHNKADLEFALTKLFGDAQTEARVEIMTIHKSKGLEFNHVLVPYLHKRSRSDDAQLLLWRENRDGFLMGVREDPIHSWLKFADRTRNENEEKRLLYVACTRAKTSLRLSFTQQGSRKVGGIARFIQTIASPYDDHATPLQVTPKLEQADIFAAHGLTRLPKSYVWSAPAVAELPPSQADRIAVADVIGSRREVALGIIVHQALAWRAHQQCDEAEVMGRLPSWLRQQQIDEADIEPILERARDHLNQTFTDPTGRWILEPHPQHECEVALSGVVDHTVIHVVLDRMFLSEGIRWIVDYKTTDLSNHNIDAAVARYRPQLQQYVQVVADLFPEPVRTGLYFTHSSQFIEL
ncbi:MAG: UvrD-helicase domain-containing protein, partial [Gammaproteobacteria bacterium]|nr:UvrD-helicase domain-containing protein [Gammaproteobacteria bacterium]